MRWIAGQCFASGQRQEQTLVRFTPATLSDVPVLVALRDALATWLLQQGIEQWNPGEFGVERMRRWVADGRVFVHRRDGEPVAAVAVIWDDPRIWPADEVKAGYIHLLMVDRRFPGEGLGMRCCGGLNGTSPSTAGQSRGSMPVRTMRPCSNGTPRAATDSSGSATSVAAGPRRPCSRSGSKRT